MDFIRKFFRAGVWYWGFPDGTSIPMISGGDGPPTLQELRDQRAAIVDQIDDILNTVREAERSELDEDERTRHDELDAQFRALTEQIEVAERAQSDAERFQRQEERRRMASVNASRFINTDEPPSAERSLDELYWATDEYVEAGSFNRAGQFIPNPFGVRNVVEQVVIRSDVDDNGSIGVGPRMSEFLPQHQPRIRSFQRTVADMILFGLMIDRDVKSSRAAFQAARNHRLMKPRWEHALRALDVDTAAEGQNWVPTGMGADVHMRVRAAGKIAPLFARIDLPTNPWTWPVEGADAVAYLVAEPTSDTSTKVTASTPGTNKATFDAEIFGARTLFSRSLEPDSAIAILPYTRSKLIRAFVDAEEKAILDGDTAGTHQDADVTAAADARKAWDGLRKKALAQTASDGANAANSVAKIRAARKLMGKWGLNPADVVIITSIAGYFDLLNDDKVTTVDKLGAQATLLNGQLGQLDGSPIIVSEHVRQDLNATGVFDDVTEDRTYALTVNRGEYAIGQRMALDVEVDDSIYRESFQRVVVAFMREDFQHIGDAAANEDAAIVYNLAR